MERTYQNPFRLTDQWEGNQLGDPFIMRFDGRYYLYCSSHTAHIKCWQSDELVNWRYIGSVCDLAEIDGAYAPEVWFLNGAFYMVTSPKGSGHYLLKAAVPEGPFELLSDNFGLLIDGSLFIDNNGDEYLFRAGHKGIVGHQMPTPDFPEMKGTIIDESYLQHWTEGPMVIFREGRYFLTYTGNHLLSRGYRICYSVSDTTPLEGYRNMDNRLLLLEVGDEFHALGHSSTVLGPDMDSYFIAYHNFNFCVKPAERSLNIDRLLFNEARMRGNATWWPQEVPKLPAFSCRGESALEARGDYRFLTWEGKRFTTEWNILPKGKPIAFVAGANEWVIEQGDMPKNLTLAAHCTLRAAYRDGKLSLFINNLWLGDRKAAFDGGDIGIRLAPEQTLGYIGISGEAGGSYDHAAQKSVPGSWDAVHALEENLERETVLENGMPVSMVKCDANTQLRYRLNVKEAGEYSLFARIRDEKGLSVRNMGVFRLAKGDQVLPLSGFARDCLLDTFECVAYQAVSSMHIVENGHQTDAEIQIIGHKRQKSMIHKYCGFTCAENLGMALIGDDGWTDYRVKCKLYMEKDVPGGVSVYLRSTRASWFPDQVRWGMCAYRLALEENEVRLSRCEYDEKVLVTVPVRVGSQPLSITMQGDTLSVLCNNQEVLTYRDPNQMTHGKVGFDAYGEGHGILDFKVEGIAP